MTDIGRGRVDPDHRVRRVAHGGRVLVAVDLATPDQAVYRRRRILGDPVAELDARLGGRFVVAPPGDPAQDGTP
ncbi:hypothetical protein BOX37_23335 [Nocardia mangyaensis]|uniref:Uncharacterized protein n=1 Tax=Nocardia mangyaensis TaxID=2213200 RepID=A0A1J0VWI6_9NOCA|nr:hypothetical protein BOX37_23335 [Nocardia mangyaensis]